MLERKSREEEGRDWDAAGVKTEEGSIVDQRRTERDGLWSGAAEEDEGRQLRVVTIVT